MVIIHNTKCKEVLHYSYLERSTKCSKLQLKNLSSVIRTEIENIANFTVDHRRPLMIFDFYVLVPLSCSSHPCINAGTCHEAEIDFKCVCPLGYKGDTCQGNYSQTISHFLFLIFCIVFRYIQPLESEFAINCLVGCKDNIS